MSMPSMRRLTAALIPASLAVLAMLGCVDVDGGGSTSGTALYAVDSSTSPPRVLAWDNVTTLYGIPATAPTRTIQNSVFTEIKDLAWNGLVMGASRLYIVSAGGKAVRVENARTQPSGYTEGSIVSFYIGDPDRAEDRLSGGQFGQASFDSTTNTLYVCEKNTSTARVWVIANPEAYASGAKTPSTTIKVSGDLGDMGVCTLTGSVFATFEDGDEYTKPLTSEKFDGPRIRRGNGNGFGGGSTDVVFSTVSATTALSAYGAMAMDTGNSRFFVARHLTDAALTGSPILIYRVADFGTDMRLVPTLMGPTTLTGLRVLAHPGNKDWLAGALSVSTEASNLIYLWKNPNPGVDPVVITLDTTVRIKGLALDGNN